MNYYKRGEKYEVKVAIFDISQKIETKGQEYWQDDYPDLIRERGWYHIINHYELPIHDNLHNDRESGQEEKHYHVDTRFVFGRPPFFRIIPENGENFRIEKKLLECHREKEQMFTPSKLIKNSKKFKKGNILVMNGFKCIHKGYDLSNVKPDDDGIITCPLHGLQYCSRSHLLITNLHNNQHDISHINKNRSF